MSGTAPNGNGDGAAIVCGTCSQCHATPTCNLPQDDGTLICGACADDNFQSYIAGLEAFERGEKLKRAREDRDIERYEAKQQQGDKSFGARRADLSKMRPVEFVWKPWLVRGCLNLIVGEESIGKSTFIAYIAAGITTGEFGGAPADVLFIGADEDDFNSVTLPRLYAAGAHMLRVHNFIDGGQPLDVAADCDKLGGVLAQGFGLVAIEHLLDILPSMRNPNDPAAIRRACKPLRRVLAEHHTTALAANHVNKAASSEFRQRSQGSGQFNAMARSAFLIDRHPTDPTRRVAVLGKTNYVRSGQAALSFALADHTFTHNGEAFSIGRVVDAEDADDVTMADVLAAGPSAREQQRDNRTQDVLDQLAQGAQSAEEIIKATGIPRATVFRILSELKEAGQATNNLGLWAAVSGSQSQSQSQSQSLKGSETETDSDQTTQDELEGNS